MLIKCSTALLISDVKSFSDNYEALAMDIGVDLEVAKTWKKMYRMNKDVVILGSKYLSDLNTSYYPKAVIILKEDENPSSYIKLGISRFIFDYKNQHELMLSMFMPETVTIHTSSRDVEHVIKITGTSSFSFGNYEFRFADNRFLYKGKPIYLCNSQKSYLAEWLLNGHKDNNKRMILCNLRKKFGADFLDDVDRFGQIRRNK